MKFSAEATALMDSHKDRIVGLLERNPATPAELPRRWPITRPFLRYLLEELERDGRILVVAHRPGTRAPVYAPNPYPRSELPRARMRLAS